MGASKKCYGIGLSHRSVCVSLLDSLYPSLPHSVHGVTTGLPHRAMEHSRRRYQDYNIPAGSTVVTNIWGIMHDEAVYSDPSTFKPDCFLPTSGGVRRAGLRAHGIWVWAL
ncbi:hypothetical protein V8D89_000489 [Ganoderma adspersum]